MYIVHWVILCLCKEKKCWIIDQCRWFLLLRADFHEKCSSTLTVISVPLGIEWGKRILYSMEKPLCGISQWNFLFCSALTSQEPSHRLWIWKQYISLGFNNCVMHISVLGFCSRIYCSNEVHRKFWLKFQTISDSQNCIPNHHNLQEIFKGAV